MGGSCQLPLYYDVDGVRLYTILTSGALSIVFAFSQNNGEPSKAELSYNSNAKTNLLPMQTLYTALVAWLLALVPG